MAANACSARDIRLGGGVGILISSLTRPRRGCLSSCSESSRYRTLLSPRFRLPVCRPASKSPSCRRKGSSSPVPSSPMSPVSLQSENSEPADSDRGEAENPLCFSSSERKEADWSCSCDRLLTEGRFRSGILAGRRVLLEEGIVKVVELMAAAPPGGYGPRRKTTWSRCTILVTTLFGWRCDGRVDYCTTAQYEGVCWKIIVGE